MSTLDLTVPVPLATARHRHHDVVDALNRRLRGHNFLVTVHDTYNAPSDLLKTDYAMWFQSHNAVIEHKIGTPKEHLYLYIPIGAGISVPLFKINGKEATIDMIADHTRITLPYERDSPRKPILHWESYAITLRDP